MVELPAGNFSADCFSTGMGTPGETRQGRAVVVPRSEAAGRLLQGAQVPPHRPDFDALRATRRFGTGRGRGAGEALGTPPAQPPGAGGRTPEDGTSDARCIGATTVDAQHAARSGRCG